MDGRSAHGQSARRISVAGKGLIVYIAIRSFAVARPLHGGFVVHESVRAREFSASDGWCAGARTYSQASVRTPLASTVR